VRWARLSERARLPAAGLSIETRALLYQRNRLWSSAVASRAAVGAPFALVAINDRHCASMSIRLPV